MTIKDHQIDSAWRNEVTAWFNKVGKPTGAAEFNTSLTQKLKDILAPDKDYFDYDEVLANESYGDFDVSYEYSELGPILMKEKTTGRLNRTISSYFSGAVNTHDAISLPDLNKVFFIEYLYDENKKVTGYRCRKGEPKTVDLGYKVAITGTMPKDYNFNIDFTGVFSEIRQANPAFCQFSLTIVHRPGSLLNWITSNIGDESDPVKLTVPMVYNTNGAMILDPRSVKQFVIEEYLNKGGTHITSSALDYEIQSITLNKITTGCNLMFSSGSQSMGGAVTTTYLAGNTANYTSILNYSTNLSLSAQITSAAADEYSCVKINDKPLIESLIAAAFDDVNTVEIVGSVKITHTVSNPLIEILFASVNNGKDYDVYAYADDPDNIKQYSMESTAPVTDEYDDTMPKLALTADDLQALILDISDDIPPELNVTAVIFDEQDPNGVIFVGTDNNVYAYPTVFSNTCVIPKQFTFQVQADLVYADTSINGTVKSNPAVAAICSGKSWNVSMYRAADLTYKQIEAYKAIHGAPVSITYSAITTDPDVVVTTSQDGSGAVYASTQVDTMIPL